MKKCISCLLYVSPFLCVANAASLRRNPTVSAGIGSIDNTQHASNGKATPSTADFAHPEYTLTLQNYKGVQYFAPIMLNNQKMSAVFDTGSFEIMAMSKACTACKIPAPLVKYDNASSPTFIKGKHGIENHYFAGGTVVARQDYETVRIGDLGKDFTVAEMPFWQIVDTDMLVWMSNRARFTAIVGLGHRTTVPESAGTVETLLERTETDLFSICLEKGASNPGHLTFNPKVDLMGQTDSAQFTASSGSATSQSMFRKLPVIGKNHWTVRINEVSTSNGKDTINICNAGQSCVAVVDSGTSLIAVPPLAVPMIKTLIQSVKADCSNIDQLQDLVFNLAGHQFVMPPSAWVVKFENKGVTKCLPAFTDFKMSSAMGSVWILGMPFLRRFYTVFDRITPSLYVADQGPNCQPAVHNSTMNQTFVTTSGGMVPRVHEEPAFVDIDEAQLPSWAFGESMID
jgi:hypothetical protein